MKGTAAEKLQRDAAVVADRARGLPWRLVAERNGLSESAAREAWAARSFEYEERPARDVIRDQLRQFDATIEELAELAVTSANDSIRLGAIRTRHEVCKDKLVLLHQCNLIRPLPLVGIAYDAEAFGKKLVELFEEHDVDRAVAEGVMAVAEEAQRWVRVA